MFKSKSNIGQFKPKQNFSQPPGFRAEEEAPEEEQVDLNRYKDPSGVSLRKLEIGLWLVKNKKNFLSLFLGFLIVLSAILWTYYFYNFGMYIFSGMKSDMQAFNRLASPDLFPFSQLSLNKADDIVVSDPVVLKSGAKYDFIAKIKNPNMEHFAHFTYAFETGSGLYGRRSGFILPGQSKYLLALGEVLPQPASRAKLVLEELSWLRVDKKEIIDWQIFASDRLNMGTREEKFVPGQSSGLSENIILNRLEFVAYNNTPFNYYETDFNIILLSNNQEIGAYKHRIDRFMSGEERSVDLTLPYNIGNVNSILIEPEIDITRDDIYIEIGEKYR